MNFGREFTEAVEMKQVAQQEAERARFLVEKVLNFVVYFVTNTGINRLNKLNKLTLFALKEILLLLKC